MAGKAPRKTPARSTQRKPAQDATGVAASANPATDKEKGHRHYSTEEIIKAIHKANGIVSKAARILKCDRDTIYARRNEPAIAQAIESARYYAVDAAEEALDDLVEKREVAAVIFTLKTQGKSRGWVERQEITGANGGVIRVVYEDVPTPGDD